MQARTSHSGAESRAAGRTNLFLAATLHSAGIGRPVKIRDLSATGARIEVSPVPEAGAAVTLVRGPLSVAAKVSWSAERFCGLSFTAPVSIPDWMSNPAVARSEADQSGRIAEELSRVSRLLGTLGETLAADPGLVFKYGTQLYNLGLAERSLADLATAIRAAKPC